MNSEFDIWLGPDVDKIRRHDCRLKPIDERANFRWTRLP